MKKINQELLDRLARKLGVGLSQVYARIDKYNRGAHLDRPLAALRFADSQGINIQKYATPDDLAQLRRSGGGDSATIAPQLAQEAPRAIPPKSASAGKRKAKKSGKRTATKDNSVFVVHGRNEALRRSMFEFLRALGLHPLEWSEAVLRASGPNPYVGDVLDTAMEQVAAVVVLLSPDEEAKLKDEFCSSGEKKTEGKLQGQARPNVLFEAGLALGAHPKKTLIVQVGKVRKISDIAGLHIVHLTNDPKRRNDFAGRLEKIIGAVSRVGNDWTDAGDFNA